jgi:AmmeMemoRadiSam system protein B
MNSVRSPAVSDMFYPGEARTLQQMIRKFLDEVKKVGKPPKAIIAPHAGYIYSGPVAASAYALIAPEADLITRVVLLGPSHRVPFAGIAAPHAAEFETPLGRIEVDHRAIDLIIDLPWVLRSDRPHAPEHSLEVHLPFLQTVLKDFKLVPLVVGDAEPAHVGKVIDRLWGGAETLIVISSDLSHYLDYESAKAIDSKTTRAIEELRAEDIEFNQACGRLPVQGLLRIAKQRGLHCETVDLRNSGDTAGPRDQVVGYGAYVFH